MKVLKHKKDRVTYVRVQQNNYHKVEDKYCKIGIAKAGKNAHLKDFLVAK